MLYRVSFKDLWGLMRWGEAWCVKRAEGRVRKTKLSVFHTTGNTDDYLNGTCKVFLKYALPLMGI